MYHVHPIRVNDDKIKEVNEMIDRLSINSCRYNNRYIFYHNTINLENAVDGTKKWCIDTAYNILSQYYPITNECKLFEIWKYKLDNTKLAVRTPLTIHTDNDNGDDIHTFILYTRKDPEIKGGNLNFYKSMDGEIYSTVNTETGMMVCIDGSVYHCPEVMSGSGIRNCIVIQFNRKT